MEKRILEELYRIRKMMGLKGNNSLRLEQIKTNLVSDPVNYIMSNAVMPGLPADITAGAIEMGKKLFSSDSNNPNKHAESGTDEYDAARYGTRTIFPAGSGNKGLSGFNNKEFKILSPRNGGEPEVWKMKPGMKAEDLFGAKVKRGAIEDASGTIHEDQPYIERGDKKLCLPDQRWFDKFGSIDGGLVYKFKSPKNGKSYAIEMVLRDEALEIDSAQLTGLETAIACKGLANGWMVSSANIIDKRIDGGRTPYKEVGCKTANLDCYWTDDIKAELLDTRSNDDIWWDTYGLQFEIAVGVVISLATLGIGTAFAITSTIGRVLLVAAEIIVEVITLAGKWVNSWERGNEVDAIMTIVFCFLPVLFEIKPLKKFLSGGISKVIQKTDVEKLLIKVKDVEGGWKRIMDQKWFASAEGKAWYNTLDEGSKIAFKNGMELAKNLGEKTPKELEEFIVGLNEYFIKNEKTILDAGVPKEKLEWMDEIAANFGGWVQRNYSLEGTGIMPTLFRGFVVIGPMAHVLNSVGLKIKDAVLDIENKTEKDAEEVVTRFMTALKNRANASVQDFYLLQLYAEVNGETNLTDKYYNAFKETYYDENGNLNMDNEEVTKKLNEKLDKLDEEAKAKLDNYLKQEKFNELTTNVVMLNQLITNINLIEEELKKLNFTDIKITSNSSSFDNPWDITIKYNDNTYNGKVMFEKKSDNNYNIKLLINDVEVFPVLTKSIEDITSSNTSQATTGILCKKTRSGSWVKTDSNTFNLITNPKEKCESDTETTCDFCKSLPTNPN